MLILNLLSLIQGFTKAANKKKAEKPPNKSFIYYRYMLAGYFIYFFSVNQ